MLGRAADAAERVHGAAARCYARRLLHRDPEGRYSAIVMTWGPGQGTAVHDHGGLWCVEGVVDGEIAVTQYLVQQDTDGYYRVTPIGSLLAGTGFGRLPDSADRSSRAGQRAADARVGHAARLRRRSRRLQGVPAGDADGRYAESTRMLSFNE